MATKATSVSLNLFTRPYQPDPREKRYIAE